jgi:hypothetical protein
MPITAPYSYSVCPAQISPILVLGLFPVKIKHFSPHSADTSTSNKYLPILSSKK